MTPDTNPSHGQPTILGKGYGTKPTNISLICRSSDGCLVLGEILSILRTAPMSVAVSGLRERLAAYRADDNGEPSYFSPG
jgi:hypothetical protein